MTIEVEHRGTQVTVEFIVISPGVPPSVSGSPDSWAPGEPGELEIKSVEEVESSDSIDDDGENWDDILDANWDNMWDVVVEADNDAKQSAAEARRKL